MSTDVYVFCGEAVEDLRIGHVTPLTQITFGTYHDATLPFTLRDAIKALCIASGHVVESWVPEAAHRLVLHFHGVLTARWQESSWWATAEWSRGAPESSDVISADAIREGLKARVGLSWAIHVD